MKMSFSLSSLQPSSGSLERAEHARTRVERPYNSLTKKRKEPMQEQCTKNSSGSEDGKDDFWAAIRTNYDYIMDTNLIDTCKEANGELAWDEGDVSTVSWGLKEVSCQFSELYSWLRVLQEMVYSKEENLLDKSLRVAHTEELRRKAYRRRLFNEQAEKLMARAPSLKEEVSWRVDHLNAKWDLVEQIMAPVQSSNELDDQDISADFEHEVKCLRKWLREMEDRLQPLKLQVDWSRTEVEEKAMEHMVLQKDIESHGRIVSSVVKLGERVADGLGPTGDGLSEELGERRQQALRLAANLERRWHLLFLRALEWQCHIEALAQRVRSKVSASRSSDSSDSDDKEPVTKQPRLSRRVSQSSSSSASSSSSQDESGAGSSSSSRVSGPPRRRSSVRARRQLRARSKQSSSSNDSSGPSHPAPESSSARSELSSDSDVSSENRFLDDGSYFEDDLDELCVTKLPEEAYVSKRLGRAAFGDQGAEADIEEAGLSEEEEASARSERRAMTPTPSPTAIDQIDSAAMPPSNDTPQKRRRTDMDEAALFNTSNRKSKNCATFYFKHMDTDSDAGSNASSGSRQHRHQADESSEEEWTYTSARVDAEQLQNKQNNARTRLVFDDSAGMKTEPEDDASAIEDALNGNLVGESSEADRRDAKTNENNNSDDECANSKESIRRLISEVEKLVREEGRPDRRVCSLIFAEDSNKSGSLSPQNHRAKYARIKEWLALNSARCREGRCTSQYCQLTASETLDSCDASGEYTTGESDVERQCETSEEERGTRSSVVSWRRVPGNVSQSNSEEILEPVSPQQQQQQQSPPLESSTPKVVMRSKRSGPRPWSVSCITQIRKRASLEVDPNEPISQFSISETALHKLVTSPPAKASSLDNSESRAPFNNSTSTLLEETIIGHDARVVRNSSLRRKKSRLRKKNVSRKSESGSDGVVTNQRSEGSDDTGSRSTRKCSITGRAQPARHLVKSGSFSGCVADCGAAERATASEPNAKPRTASSESDDDPEETVASPGLRGCEGLRKRLNAAAAAAAADSDLEKNSLGNHSFSEQATWDNYQEKYMSEPYSEVDDIETARRLLEFGDDYRNFLDSQSDCASSLSAVHYKSNVTSEESDSDSEFKRLTRTSRSQLLLTEARYGAIPSTSFVCIAGNGLFNFITFLRDLIIRFVRWAWKKIKNGFNRAYEIAEVIVSKVTGALHSIWRSFWTSIF